ncbi:hypothetical protein B7463_g11813, partial [Scytalidium lignicola]
MPPSTTKAEQTIDSDRPISKQDDNPFDKMFDGEEDSDDEWWNDDEDKTSSEPSEAPATARITQWPRVLDPGTIEGNHKHVSRMSTRRVKKGYSVVKPTRDKSRGRQKKQNAKAGIKLVTNFTKSQGLTPDQLPRQEEMPRVHPRGQFVDLATLQALDEGSKKMHVGFWKSKSKTEAGISSKVSVPQNVEPSPLKLDPITADRHGQNLSPLNVVSSLSPNDRAIPIGICLESANLSQHTTSPKSAGSEQSKISPILPSHWSTTNDSPETPTIIITPAQEQSTWSPFDDIKAPSRPRPRATSSFYSQAPAEDVFRSNYIPPLPKLPSSTLEDDEHKAVALKSCFSPDSDDGTTFDYDNNYYDERMPRPRVVSGCTVFEEDESPILVRSGRATSISLGSKAARHASISTVGTRRQSKGWWNYITTPFNLTRSNTINDAEISTQQTPALPSLATAAAKAKESEWVRQWEKGFSPITPETTTTTIASDAWWSPISPKNYGNQVQSPAETRAVEPNGHQVQESSGTLPFFLPSGDLGDAVLENSPVARSAHSSSPQETVRPDHLETSPERFGAMNNNGSVNRDTQNNNPFVQPTLSDLNPSSTQAQLSRTPAFQPIRSNALRVPPQSNLASSEVSPPPYSPPKAHMPRYRAVFPPDHPLNVQYPASPGPISPGMQQALAPPGAIQMSEVPEVESVTPAVASTRRPINLNSGYPELPTRENRSAAKKAQKAELKRRRHEKEDVLARRAGGWWRGRGCIPERGCYGRMGAEGRKRRRWYLGLTFAFLLIITLVLVLVMKLHRKTNNFQQSQWLNLTGFPPIFTGLSTIAAPVNIQSVTACAVPSTVWSCALPKELQSSVAPNQPNQPNFLLYIQWDNSSSANATFENIIGNKNLPSRSLVGNTVSARQFIRHMAVKARQAITFTPSPAPPSLAEEEFLGNTTDGIVSDQKAGEATPFYISFLSTTNSSLSVPKREVLERQPASNDSNSFPNVTDLIPPPSINPDGTAAPANLLPFPSQQPIRLYDRGLLTEHYGFYTYFDRSIFLKTNAALNNNAAGDGVVPDDENGGCSESEAVARCTWAQTRFLVQMWTRMNTTARLLNGTTSTGSSNAKLVKKQSTPITFIQPGTFPYPITITIDRHGGDASLKSIYCYGMNDREEIVPNTGTFRLENRAAGGSLINPAPSLFTNSSDPALGGFDGGDGFATGPTLYTQVLTTATTLRKRRRDDASSIGLQMKLSGLPLPRHATLSGGGGGDTCFSSIDGTEEQRDHQFSPESRRHIIPKPRRLQHDSKRQRVEIGSSDLIEQQHHNNANAPRNTTEYPYQQQTSENAPAKPTMDLRPCHICYRKPTIRADLDSFAYCERCEKRTCYICIRECERYMGYELVREEDEHMLPPPPPSFSFTGEESGDLVGALGNLEESMRRKLEHRRMVCSRCCVERGPEGEVWCLGCLRSEEVKGWDGS